MLEAINSSEKLIWGHRPEKKEKIEKTSSVSSIDKSCSISQKQFRAFKDNQTIFLFLESLGMTGLICNAVGGKVSETIPFLAAAMTPLSLSIAIKGAHSQFKMAINAVRIHRNLRGLLWIGKGLDCVGAVVANATKALSGGFKLIGVNQTIASGALFTLVFPIILMVVGAISIVSQGGSLFANVKALNQFSKKCEGSEKNIQQLSDILTFIQNPFGQRCFSPFPKGKETQQVEKQIFIENHVRSSLSLTELQKKVAQVFEKRNLFFLSVLKDTFLDPSITHYVWPKLIRIESDRTEALEGQISRDSILADIHSIRAILDLYILGKSFSPIELISQLEVLYDKIPFLLAHSQLLEYWKDKNIIDDLVKNLKKDHQLLKEWKEGFLQDGNEAIERFKSEMRRTIVSNAVLLLIGTVILAAGLLYLTCPQKKMIASILSFSSSGLMIIYLLFNKSVSQEQFYRLENFLYSIPKRSLEQKDFFQIK